MEGPLPERGMILRAAIGIGLYAMAFGASFGAISIGSGLTVPQTMVLSLVMFTGASQFVFVGLAATGGSPFAAVPAALLLGMRNAFTVCRYRRSCIHEDLPEYGPPTS